MRAFVGIAGRPNRITRAYAARHGSEFLRAAWCDMAVTEAARASDNADAVLPAGDRAYTVWHAEDFRKRDRWYAGTRANVDRARAGDVVFFDWGGSDGIGYIDHVGVVVRALGGGYVETIEGNTSDRCAVKRRHYSVIAGYGRPAYSGAGKPAPSKPAPGKPGGKAPAFPGRILRQPPIMSGNDVKTWQNRMRARGWKLAADGVYGPASEEVCRAFQREKGLTVDGEVGPKTWAAAWTARVT
ncbi:peptidoglycan-binding protein [Actinomadura fulvescens]